MHQNLVAALDRADELARELRVEYQASLAKQTATPRAAQLTHEVMERLRSALDRAARRYWTLHVRPTLSQDDVDSATIYFPIAGDRQGLDSTLGRWRWKSVRGNHQPLIDWMDGKQPYSSATNDWLRILSELAVEGKHIDLVPQRRVEQRRITVSRPGSGSVSWGPGVTLGGAPGSVRIMGAPINPQTQRIEPTAGVTEEIEVLVAFLVEGFGVNALGYCQEACTKTRALLDEMSERFAI